MNFLNMHWAARWTGWAHLVLRVATGLVFFMHGYQKLTAMGVAGVSGFLGSLGVEFIGSDLCLAGFGVGGDAITLSLEPFNRVSYGLNVRGHTLP